MKRLSLVSIGVILVLVTTIVAPPAQAKLGSGFCKKLLQSQGDFKRLIGSGFDDRRETIWWNGARELDQFATRKKKALGKSKKKKRAEWNDASQAIRGVFYYYQSGDFDASLEIYEMARTVYC